MLDSMIFPFLDNFLFLLELLVAPFLLFAYIFIFLPLMHLIKLSQELQNSSNKMKTSGNLGDSVLFFLTDIPPVLFILIQSGWMVAT